MTNKVILTPYAPVPGGPYAQAISNGKLLALSGQVGIDPATGEALPGVVAQTRQALANLKAVLVAAGAGPENVIKTTCFLTDIGSFAAFNDEYSLFFGDHRPARSTVGVALAGGFLVEVEALAVLP